MAPCFQKTCPTSREHRPAVPQTRQTQKPAGRPVSLQRALPHRPRPGGFPHPSPSARPAQVLCPSFLKAPLPQPTAPSVRTTRFALLQPPPSTRASRRVPAVSSPSPSPCGRPGEDRGRRREERWERGQVLPGGPARGERVRVLWTLPSSPPSVCCGQAPFPTEIPKGDGRGLLALSIQEPGPHPGRSPQACASSNRAGRGRGQPCSAGEGMQGQPSRNNHPRSALSISVSPGTEVVTS